VPGCCNRVRPEIRLLVAADRSALCTSAGVADAWPWRYNAATPAVCGEAMLVPLMVAVAESLPIHEDVMS